MNVRDMMIRAASAMAAAALTATSPTAASAQTPDENFFFNGRHFDPETYYLDGPPDVASCVRLCPRDLSPCDSPLFKKTDGRCSRSHGN